MAVAIEFGSQGNAATSSQVATIAGLDFNAEASDRLIAAAIAFEIDAVTITGVTIGGETAAERVTATDPGGTDHLAAIWVAAVPTGTSGDVVVTISSGTGGISVATFSITGADATPTDTDTATGSAASIAISALTIPTDGAGIATFCNNLSAGAVTWTGATSSHDTNVSTARHSSAIVSTVGTNTITADGATSNQALVGVAFGPAAGGAATSLPIFSRPPRFIRRRAA